MSIAVFIHYADSDDDSEGELSKRVRYLKREEGGVDMLTGKPSQRRVLFARSY